jgi:hypothetical protein
MVLLFRGDTFRFTKNYRYATPRVEETTVQGEQKDQPKMLYKAIRHSVKGKSKVNLTQQTAKVLDSYVKNKYGHTASAANAMTYNDFLAAWPLVCGEPFEENWPNDAVLLNFNDDANGYKCSSLHQGSVEVFKGFSGAIVTSLGNT